MSVVKLLKKNFLLAMQNHYYNYAFLVNQKFPFYVKTGEQCLFMIFVLSVILNQSQMISNKLPSLFVSYSVEKN